MAFLKLVAIALLGVVALVTPLALALEDAPPVFSTAGYDDALKTCRVKGNYLIVKGTAEWCGPCKKMDKTTWRDDKVVRWVKDHGAAIQLDVDTSRQTAQSLKIRAMPTMILYKGGEEVDRVVGYRSADELLAWLNDAKAGNTSTKKTDEKLAGLRKGAEASAKDRYDLARELVQQDKLEDAAKEYLWLWRNLEKDNPSMSGVRVSFMANNIQSLINDYPPARASFSEERDATETRLKGDAKSWNDLRDWIVLNRILGDLDRTFAWIDRVKGDEEGRSSMRRLSYLLDDDLAKAGRWADLGLIIKDPIAQIDQSHGFLTSTLKRPAPEAVKHMKPDMDRAAQKQFRESSARVYAGLLAAGREDEAGKTADRILDLDDTPQARMALVRQAVEAKQPREQHLTWLEQSARSGEPIDELSTIVKAGLKK